MFSWTESSTPRRFEGRSKRSPVSTKPPRIYRRRKSSAFAPAALREAGDADKLLNLIRTRTVSTSASSSGAEEARLISTGILSNENLVGKNRFALVDIGGGAVREVQHLRGREVLHSESFALGTRSPPAKSF